MEISANDAAHRVELSADVVIVGTGAGGASMAAELSLLGLSVIMIEEGGHHKTESFNTDPTASFRRLYRDSGMSVMLGRPHIGYAEGRCVGGSTVVNGGMSWRTPDRILREWVEQGLPELGPEDMAPHFDRVEKKISVAYQSPESIGKDSLKFKEGAEALGLEVVPNLRNQHHCLGSNNCMFGCPNKAKRSTLVTYVPEAMDHGATLVHGCRVERILMAGSRAVGVVGQFVNERFHPNGKTLIARGKTVVISAGAAQSPALLMRSGFGGYHLGRHLSVHPNAKCIGLFKEGIVGWHGVHQAFQIREYQDEGLIFGTANIPPGIVALSMDKFGKELGDTMARYNDMLVSAVLVEDSHTGRVHCGLDGQPILTYFLNNQDMANFVRGVAIQSEVFLAAGADTILTPFPDFPVVHNQADVEKLRRARLSLSKAEIFTVHIMGTCRMGTQPSNSVTDAYGRVHHTDNLFVSDASIFPGPIGVNPMESILALSTRNAPRVAATAESLGSAKAPGWAPVAASPEPKGWTFEALCEASEQTLEKVLRYGLSPKREELEGYEFRGKNPPFFARLLGIQKFIKGFFDHQGQLFGYNVPVVQDRSTRVWRALPEHERPKRFGFFEVAPVELQSRDNKYPNAWLLDYGKGQNPAYDPSQVLRDYIIQVEPGNPQLLLGKATLKLGPARVATNFFVLERLRPAPKTYETSVVLDSGHG